MIGDGHYLNTIFELGPTLVATAVRLKVHTDEKGDGETASNTLFFY